jgi:S-ribosylhomocysteine lyase LuxS involved in autoinducer biosynthesis
VLPPIANHSEDHNSTLWNTENNDEIIGVIRRSIETLQAKKMRFVPSLGDADCGGNSTP